MGCSDLTKNAGAVLLIIPYTGYAVTHDIVLQTLRCCQMILVFYCRFRSGNYWLKIWVDSSSPHSLERTFKVSQSPAWRTIFTTYNLRSGHNNQKRVYTESSQAHTKDCQVTLGNTWKIWVCTLKPAHVTSFLAEKCKPNSIPIYLPYRVLDIKSWCA